LTGAYLCSRSIAGDAIGTPKSPTDLPGEPYVLLPGCMDSRCASSVIALCKELHQAT
jgi:hypothetical protein